MNPEQATALRKPFPPESIGKLPKGGQMLDYVGHAAVCDRLLTVDPGWTWEPLALDEHGLPALDRAGNLWIRLTVCDVTRIGVGDGKNAKECIGDALRNAAMRFGVALDLWAKENLVEFAMAANTHMRQAQQTPAAIQEGAAEAMGDPHEPWPEARTPKPDGITTAQQRKLGALMREAGITTREAALAYVNDVLPDNRTVESRTELTKTEAGRVIDALERDTAPQTKGEQS